MEFFGARVLQDLSQGPREESEVVRFELCYGGVGPEVEAGEQGGKWERLQDELFMVVRRNNGYH